MNKKKLFFVFCVCMFLGIMTGYASCEKCKPGNCSECGCIENKNNTACIYSNYLPIESLKTCGQGSVRIEKIPPFVPKVVSVIYILIQIIVPIILTIFGTLDLFKGITAQKDEEIKKGQKIFIKRIISAVLVFFVLVIVKFVISLAADNSSNGIIDCMECFIENKCGVG